MDDPARAFFAHLCHQLPERTLGGPASAMWLCARCTGFYGGVLVATIAHAVFRRGSARPRAMLAVAALLIGIGVVDALSPGLLPSTNLVRFVTGLGAGVGIGMAANPLLRSLITEGSTPDDAGANASGSPSSGSPSSGAHAVSIATAAILMVGVAGYGPQGVLAGVSIVSGVGFVITAWLVNALLAARVWVGLGDRQGARGRGVAAIAGALLVLEVIVIWISPVRRG